MKIENIPQQSLNPLFDFGFTAVTEEELEVVQTAKEQAEGHLETSYMIVVGIMLPPLNKNSNLHLHPWTF